MRSKLQWIDLALCAGCFFCVLLQRTGWQSPAFFFVALSMMLRLVVSFSLAQREKRTWIPLLLFFACYGLMISCRVNTLFVNTMIYVSAITGITYNKNAALVLGGLLFVWMIILPLVYYLVLLFRHKLVKAELKMKDLFGAILWHDRTAQYFMTFFSVTLLTLLIGLSMQTRLCFLSCLSMAPFCYWLVCRYQGIKAKRLWLMVGAMILFWYAQPFGGILRATLLAVSFCMVVDVCAHILRETKKYLLTVISIVCFAVFLPSFAIGYNQYACINYPRMGFGHLPGYQGILYIEDAKNDDLIGLRDRYGLLVAPEYEHICMGEDYDRYFFGCCRLQKDGYSQIYDIWGNEIIASDRNAKLQGGVSDILKDYYANVTDPYRDAGEIKITDLATNHVIGHARIEMHGIPILQYEDDTFLPDDTAAVETGCFMRTDSVNISETSEYRYTKNVLSYSENLPDDSCARYNVYIRLAQDESPKEADIKAIMQKVRELDFWLPSSSQQSTWNKTQNCKQ